MCIKSKKIKKALNLLLFIGISLSLFLYSSHFEVYEGGRDNYAHYFISKYSWLYPKLFLDHWGKPIFTLLTSPFAQWGIKGIVLFNILIGVFTLFVLNELLKELRIKAQYLALIFLLFSPIYFVLLMSAMTEVLAAFLLTFSLLLLVKKRYSLAAIVFSSLVLVRTETYIFYPLIIIYFLLLGKYLEIFLIFLFPVVYSFIGYFVYNDLFWLITHNPYAGASDVYGSGSPFHFLLKSPEIFGWPLLVFSLIGLMVTFYQLVSNKITERETKYIFVLIHFFWLALFTAHSVAYWMGNKSSLGLIRVLVPVLPLAAASGMIGLNFIDSSVFEISFFKRKFSRYLIFFFIIVAQVIQPWIQLPIPYKFNESDKVLISALNWIKGEEYFKKKIFYFDVFVPFYLNLNPYDTSRIREGIINKKYPERDTKIGDVIVYDTRYAPIEGGLQLEVFMKNPFFQLINYFSPIVEEKTLNERAYEVYIFLRIDKSKEQSERVLDSIKAAKYLNAFSIPIPESMLIQGNSEFVDICNLELNQKARIDEKNILHISFDFTQFSGDLSNVGLCMSFEKQDSIIAFFSVPIDHFLERNSFDQFIRSIDANRLKIFIWNMDKKYISLRVENISAFLAKKVY
ncbi:hypothetical protein [Thermaurantimonas aggregans]|uniref:hypothetical protein n=1 Tax=Thermaurantimonas aggregans TaxID=2173829 RepID=UPI0023F1DD42|nr:hypothetical protein [Thermaurantimonas aggregans]